MAAPVDSSPGFHSVNVYLVVPNSIEALAFYVKALGAKPRFRMSGPGGENTTMHGEMLIGDSIVMMSDENPDWGCLSPKTLGGTPVSIHLYVPDTDAAFAQAVAAGCTVRMPPSDMFWGDRFASVIDPYGHVWSLATPQEDLSHEELQKRHAAALEQMCQGPPQ